MNKQMYIHSILFIVFEPRNNLFLLGKEPLLIKVDYIWQKHGFWKINAQS